MANADESERHPNNYHVRRGVDGVWGSDEISVEDWEAPNARVILPPQMQSDLGFMSPVMRWSRSKYNEVINTHPRDLHIIEDLSNHLNKWKFLGREKGDPEKRRVLLYGDDNRWYSVTLGILLGSENVVSVTGSRRRGFVRNRLEGMVEIIVRDDE
ncbi:MAG: hypothetical protein KC435_08710 [Thermomicrobiales bacterium]|nr:hypothetical protein [Thermomicrobiales bacterium]